ncbi:MAG: phenylalanine--tRNA ligase subunit alpha [Patescibacteria group bacterium]|nr:phenylalanine--tRNA ligase subunit alpha [Patescibacteria group bacterium]MDD5295105.1 phenylalanine--tRNA ligase subunit alpha [Patescibacteria group bacterium]MDD5554690.1 phenylalanine--tRNA ligase subunit alpha [Patescibacteria group bacterium]
MKDKIEKLKEEILDNLVKAKEEGALRDLEIKYLGRKGELTKILRSLKDLSGNEKKEIGQLANEIKKEIEDKFAEMKKAFSGKEKKEQTDVTLPGEKIGRGHLNPVTIVQNELEDLFISMGFMVLDGPELESDFYNFTAVNIPPNHPARDMQDTFYIDKKNKDGEYDLVMRTHTSSVQVRAMQKYGAPLRCVVPGKCFRCEATDVRHEHTFYQIEGLMIDKNISLANMKAVLETVAKKLYGEETKLRMRPKFYPFVEPGANGEVTCFLCQGEGCLLCKNSGWLEIFGSGLVHPNVLRNGGIDPKIYSGFAFGFGLNRVTQLKYGIDDVRLFNSGDMRFLQQF